MYARWRISNGQPVKSVVLLGPTFTASNESGNLLDSYGTPDGQFNDWADYVQHLSDANVNVLIVDDGASGSTKDGASYAGSVGVVQYEKIGLIHNSIDPNVPGSNNSEQLKSQIYNWVFTYNWK
jgi:hypothetical protein